MSSMSAARVSALLRQAVAEGLTDAATFVRDETRPRTPDDPATGSGDLSDSLTVSPASPGSLESSVYTDAEHAMYQHEALNIRHPTGESKFLENTTRDSADEVGRIIAATVRRRLG